MSDALLPDDEILQQALHARVIQRCRRALLHEVRNGLQPMHAGLEALSRVLALSPFPLDKAQRYIQLVRQASTSQEQALERAIERIAPDRTAEQAVDLVAMVREVTRFLSSDAAVSGVRLQVDLPATLFVRARPHHLRMICLACTLDAIDAAASEGQLTINAQLMGQQALLQFTDTRVVPRDFQPATAGERPTARDLHLLVARRLLRTWGGELDCLAGHEVAGYTIAISFEVAEAPTA